MTVPMLPSGSTPAFVPSPHWQRRLDEPPGVVDTAAAQRLYERTGGWAMQRIARAGELAARHTSVDHSDAAGELPLARAPVVNQPSSEDAASGVADAGIDFVHAVETIARTATPATAAPALAMRLQRRISEPGIVTAELANQVGRESAAVSLRTGLHTHLAARSDTGALSPQPTVRVSTNPARHIARMALDESAAIRTTPASGADVPHAPRAAESSEPAHPAADHPVSKTDPLGALLPVVRLTARRPSAVVASQGLGGEPSTSNGGHEIIPLATSGRSRASDISVSPVLSAAKHAPLRRSSESSATAPLQNGTAFSPLAARGPSVSRAPAPALARAISSPQTNAAFASTAPFNLSLVHRGSSEPHALARMPEADDARAVQSTHDSAAAQAAEASSFAGRAAEVSIAAATVPKLVWRSAERASHAQPGHQDGGSSGVLMRAEANTAATAAPPSSMPTPALPASQEHVTQAASAPTLDLGRLAEHVTRLIVRRLDVECERRGAKRWR